jgi:hypothetical protein
LWGFQKLCKWFTSMFVNLFINLIFATKLKIERCINVTVSESYQFALIYMLCKKFYLIKNVVMRFRNPLSDTQTLGFENLNLESIWKTTNKIKYVIFKRLIEFSQTDVLIVFLTHWNNEKIFYFTIQNVRQLTEWELSPHCIRGPIFIYYHFRWSYSKKNALCWIYL